MEGTDHKGLRRIFGKAGDVVCIKDQQASSLAERILL